MGGSIPFRSTAYDKQAHYLNPILHSWRGLKSGRERAMPHIKVYSINEHGKTIVGVCTLAISLTFYSFYATMGRHSRE